MLFNRSTTFFAHSYNDNLLTQLLTRRYIIAFSLIVIMVTAAWLTMTIFISKEKYTALTVNISGRQRMLSQQTALLSTQLVHSKAERRPAIREKLRKSVKLMLNSHLALIYGDADIGLSSNLSSQIRSMYFNAPLEVDTQIRSYLLAIEELLETPEDKLSSKTVLLENSILLPLDRLLESLDKVVIQYQTEGELTISNIQKIENFILLFTLLVLILEGYFIFYPTILKIRSFINHREKYESQLIAAKEQAEHANMAKSQFLSNMSHELRTPLTSIKGSLSLIVNNVVTETEKQKEILQISLRNTNRLQRLVDDILDFEKLRNKGIEFNDQDVNIFSLVKQSIQMEEGFASSQNVEIKLEETSCDYVILNIDPYRIQQVISNLLSNAIKYSPSGQQVSVEITCQNNRLRLAIADNGKGIPNDFQGDVFEYFSQVDSSDTREKSGTGLGLAISKEIIKHYGGIIDYEKEREQGACFYFELVIN